MAIVESQHATRLTHLVPIRIGRMLQSPFAYYRGTAAVMAADLADAPRTDHHVVICGDAHIANFGLFASPERRVLFDLNDFDEVSVGPWEWDVKRMATSVVLAGRGMGMSEAEVAEATRQSVSGYRQVIAGMTERSVLERYFFQVETDWLKAQASADALKVLRRTVKGATRRTSERALDRITTTDAGGTRTIVDQPPLMTHIDHFTVPELVDLGTQYLRTLRADVALLVVQLRLTDYALRVVGVGSVGTRCYIVLLLGPAGEPLFLQVKEAERSVVQTYGGMPPAVPPGIHDRRPRAPGLSGRDRSTDPAGAVGPVPGLGHGRHTGAGRGPPSGRLLLAAVPGHEGIGRHRDAPPAGVRGSTPACAARSSPGRTARAPTQPSWMPTWVDRTPSTRPSSCGRRAMPTRSNGTSPSSSTPSPAVGCRPSGASDRVA